MDRSGKLYSLLSLPAVYRGFKALVLGDGPRIYISDYVKPTAGERVLDIGCGPGDIQQPFKGDRMPTRAVVSVEPLT